MVGPAFVSPTRYYLNVAARHQRYRHDRPKPEKRQSTIPPFLRGRTGEYLEAMYAARMAEDPNAVDGAWQDSSKAMDDDARRRERPRPLACVLGTQRPAPQPQDEPDWRLPGLARPWHVPTEAKAAVRRLLKKRPPGDRTV